MRTRPTRSMSFCGIRFGSTRRAIHYACRKSRKGRNTCRHCTFAVTAALPLSVNVQAFVLLPPLEQAPDQTASRPFDAVSVIEIPVENDADPVPPTATLIPAGLEVTRSPPRPVAVTFSVAVCGDGGGGASGLTVNVADLVTPPPLAEIVTTVCVVTWVVNTL